MLLTKTVVKVIYASIDVPLSTSTEYYYLLYIYICCIILFLMQLCSCCHLHSAIVIPYNSLLNIVSGTSIDELITSAAAVTVQDRNG